MVGTGDRNAIIGHKHRTSCKVCFMGGYPFQPRYHMVDHIKINISNWGTKRVTPHKGTKKAEKRKESG